MREKTITLMIISLIVGLVVGGIINGSLAGPVIVTFDNMTFELELGQTLELIPKEPAVVTKTVTVYEKLPAEVIEVQREIVKEVEVIKEVPVETRGFETVAEFEDWVENNHGLITSGSASFNSHDPLNDCEDQADRWQKLALEDGYLVSACPVYNGMVFDTYVGGGKYHVGLWTSIGNEYYYWDSVGGEITKLGVVRD